MLYRNVYFEDFVEEAKKYDAEFTDDALDALFEYYDDEETDFIELDMVRIKNEWTEYESWKEAADSIIMLENLDENDYYMPEDDDKDVIESKCKDFVKGSDNPYKYLECDNGNVLVKDGIW